MKRVFDNIGRGRSAQVYLIHGEDDYAVQGSLEKLVREILPSPAEGLNLVYFDGEEDIRKICDELLTPPLLMGAKIVVIRNTGLFNTKTTPAAHFKKAAAELDNNPERAYRYFHAFLKAAGLKIEDVTGDNWRNIAEKDWRKHLGEDYPDLVRLIPVLAGLFPERDLPAADETGSAEDIPGVLRSGIPDSNCLILTAGAVDQRKALYKYISEKGVVISHAQPKYEKGKAASFGVAIREHLERGGRRITAEAASALGERTGNDARAAITEIEKVISYIGGRSTIEISDFEDTAGKNVADPAFKLNKSVQEKDLNGSLNVLSDMLEKNDPPLKMLAMIIRELRLLLQAKIILNSGIVNSYRPGMDYGSFQNSAYPEIKAGRQSGLVLAELAGQHPFVIYSALKNSTHFSYEKILTDLNYLLDMDIKFKSTGIDQRTSLETALIRVCS